MIKGGGSSGYSSDLMVCFPSRTHSSSPSDHSQHRRQNALNHRRSLTKLSGASPLIRSKVNIKKSDPSPQEEPTSPKVTCAGKIKVRSSKRGGGIKNWQSLMDEIEKIRNSKAENRFLGIKKDVIGFLTCLRHLRLDFRCFGTFPPVNIISEDKERSSKTVFSKWFMILHENQNNEKRDSDAEEAVPPANALLLMRCRSAAGKNRLESGEREEEDEEIEKKDLSSLMEEEKNMNFVVMSYDTKYYRLSSDIAPETWVVGGIQHPRTRSSKILVNL